LSLEIFVAYLHQTTTLYGGVGGKVKLQLTLSEVFLGSNLIDKYYCTVIFMVWNSVVYAYYEIVEK